MNIRYFTRVDDNPNSDTYGQPLSLHRWTVSDGGQNTLERLDRTAGQWVPNPSLVAATGIGGADNYQVVDRDAAVAFLQRANLPASLLT